jgi:hypothetical protein
MASNRIPAESAEAIFPRRERLPDGTVIEPINCQALMALSIIESPLLQQGGAVRLEDLLTAATVCLASGDDWISAIEARDAGAIRRLAIAKAATLTPNRLQELSAAIARQIERGLAGLVPLRAPGKDGQSPLSERTAVPSRTPSTTGAGRSSLSPRSSGSTTSRGRR